MNYSQWSDLRASSLQFGLFSPELSISTPESCSLLFLRSSSLRWEGSHFRAEATTSQSESEIPQLGNLQWHIYYSICYYKTRGNITFTSCICWKSILNIMFWITLMLVQLICYWVLSIFSVIWSHVCHVRPTFCCQWTEIKQIDKEEIYIMKC